ncbi:MAG: tail fiber protein [Planctomycetota bacterium]
MASPFVGEIKIFAGNFPPKGWAFCQGQILPIAQNTALFSLLGTSYGGNGTSNFALPDLQGRAAVHQGQGPGTSNYVIGEMVGAETVALTSAQIPAHAHSVNSLSTSGDSRTPAGNVWAGVSEPVTNLYTNASPNTAMNVNASGSAGGSLPHNNMQPYLASNFIIALQGIFPARS